jgi:hypothetical protein
MLRAQAYLKSTGGKPLTEMTRMDRLQSFLDTTAGLSYVLPHNALNFVNGQLAFGKDQQKNPIIRLPIIVAEDVLVPSKDLRQLNNVKECNMFAMLVFIDMVDAKPD